MSTYPRTFSHIGISVPDVEKAAGRGRATSLERGVMRHDNEGYLSDKG